MLQSWGDRDAARVHSGGVNAAYLTPDGTWAVTVSKDHTARVWNVATAECRCVLRGMVVVSVVHILPACILLYDRRLHALQLCISAYVASSKQYHKHLHL